MDKQYYEQYTREALIAQIVGKDQEIEDIFGVLNKMGATMYKFRLALALLAHRASFTPAKKVKRMSDGAFIGLGRLGYVLITVNNGNKTKVGGNISIEDANFLMRLPTQEQSKFLKGILADCEHPFVSDEEMFEKPWFKTFKENFPPGTEDPFADEGEEDDLDIDFDPDCSCCDAEDCQNRTAPYIGGGDDED